MRGLLINRCLGARLCYYQEVMRYKCAIVIIAHSVNLCFKVSPIKLSVIGTSSFSKSPFPSTQAGADLLSSFYRFLSLHFKIKIQVGFDIVVLGPSGRYRTFRIKLKLSLSNFIPKMTGIQGLQNTYIRIAF